MALRLKFKAGQDRKGVFQVATVAPTVYAVASGAVVAETTLAMHDVGAVIGVISPHTGFSFLQYLSAQNHNSSTR